ncbi:MAG: hypothetical protein ACRD8W_06420, partial [Nitrososphaeraceae archaeon]
TEYHVKFLIDRMFFEKVLIDRIKHSLEFIDFFLRIIREKPELSETYPTRAANQLQKVQKEMEVLLEMEKIRIDKAPPTHEIAVRMIEDTIDVTDEVKTKAAHAIRTGTTTAVRRKR